MKIFLGYKRIQVTREQKVPSKLQCTGRIEGADEQGGALPSKHDHYAP